MVRNQAVKNITLSADERLIAAARDQARSRNTTLNAEFRRWLESYSAIAEDTEHRVRAYDRLMESMADVRSGGRFTRDAMNERRDG